MRQREWAVRAGVLALVSATGCGLSLDLDPEAPLPTAEMDAGRRRDAGERPPPDGAGFDSAGPADDAGAAVEGGMGVSDGAAMRDGGVPACTVTPCDPVLQCGCDDRTMPTCEIDYDGSTFCRAAGSVMRDDECTYIDECAAGLTCIVLEALPPTLTSGVCTRFCGSDADCGTAGGACFELFPGKGLCTTGCDPVARSGCPGSLDCVFADYLGGTYCVDRMGFGGVGTPCTFSEECDPGTVCDASGGPSVCTQLCFVDGDCPGSATGACWHMWTLGARMLGVCPVM